MNIRFLAPAQAELDEAIAWYAELAPGLAPANARDSPLSPAALPLQRGLHARRLQSIDSGNCTPTSQTRLLAQQAQLIASALQRDSDMSEPGFSR